MPWPKGRPWPEGRQHYKHRADYRSRPDAKIKPPWLCESSATAKTRPKPKIGRKTNKWEWEQQAKLAALLDTWLDPACTYWSASDPVASSVKTGLFRKMRGVKPGQPDVHVVYRGKTIFIE